MEVYRKVDLETSLVDVHDSKYSAEEIQMLTSAVENSNADPNCC